MNGQRQIQIDLTKQPSGECPHCKGGFFRDCFIVKKVNKMLIGTPADQFVKMICWQCVDCNTIVLEQDAQTLFPDPNRIILGGSK
jgi:phage FluMu protein Com